MQITPWNWVWTVTTVVLILAALPRNRLRGFLPPFVACAAVAAAAAWSGVGGSGHFLLFPVLPFLFLWVPRIPRRGKRIETQAAGTITVPFGQPRQIESRPHRPKRPRTMAIWSPMVWAPAAVAAILLLAVGVDEPWVIALVFPVVPLLAAAVRWTKGSPEPAGEGARWLGGLAAPVVALAVAVMVAPDSGTTVAVTTTTTITAVSITIAPEVIPAIFVDVHGTIAQSDGTTLIVPVEGAFITFTGEDTARFALSDVFGHATFFVDPGSYTVFVEPPGNRWSLMEGCPDRLEEYPVATGEQWTWVVHLVDANAGVAYGVESRCDEVVPPAPGRGF